jgi:anthranilate phosphoribosyltransferase
MDQLLRLVQSGTSLGLTQAEEAVRKLLDERVPVAMRAEFLIALARKGETVEEITAFATLLRDKAVVPPLAETTRQGIILDVCGTGGDRLHTFNISTTVSIVAAAAGITVAKHGNRAITSKSGSADVLVALGIKTDPSPELAARWLAEHGFAFLFAPLYHPAFKAIAPVRKLCAERGHRTIFNFLGPLLNPARPTCQLIGSASPALCEPLAQVLRGLGLRRGMVVCGTVPNALHPDEPQFLDEFSPLGKTRVAEFYQDRGFALSDLDPALFPLSPMTLADLQGGDAACNAEMVWQILAGNDRGPRRETVLLNAAGALLVAGTVRSLLDGWELAGELIDSGKATAKLAALVAASQAAGAD